MITYPKIETLYVRDMVKHKVLVDELRMPEFGLVKEWYLTEKIDGTNVRVNLDRSGSVIFCGRTDEALMHVPLMQYLSETFTQEKMQAAFADREDADVTLFGEGYGPRIQKGGGLYRNTVSFRLFDVRVGQLWLEPDNIGAVAAALGVSLVNYAGTYVNWLPRSIDDLTKVFLGTGASLTAQEDGGIGLLAEGIVARTVPLLLDRRGNRVMWKLKFRDF